MKKLNEILAKRIKINDDFEITVGRLVFMSLIVLFQILGIMCCNNWIVTPEVFFALSTFMGSLKKVKKDEPKAD